MSSDESSAEFNPYSKFEENTVIHGLTMYEVQRRPRNVPTPNTPLQLKMKSLDTLFQCPICLGYMKKTFIVMECLHRFCGECIQKCLRIGKKECPSCRVHIPSRRNLRPDSNFDALMQKMLGDIVALEKAKDKEIESWNKEKNVNNSCAQSRKIAMEERSRKKKNKVNEDDVNEKQLDFDKRKADPGPVASRRKKLKLVNIKRPVLVDFVLCRHPREKTIENLERQFIRTSELLSIRHIKRFLAGKLMLKNWSTIAVSSVS